MAIHMPQDVTDRSLRSLKKIHINLGDSLDQIPGIFYQWILVRTRISLGAEALSSSRTTRRGWFKTLLRFCRPVVESKPVVFNAMNSLLSTCQRMFCFLLANKISFNDKEFKPTESRTVSATQHDNPMLHLPISQPPD